MITLPVTNERIESRTYRLDEKSKAFIARSLQPLSSGTVGPYEEWIREEQSIVALRELYRLDVAESFALMQYTQDLYSDFKSLFHRAGEHKEITAALFKATISALNALPEYRGKVYFGQVLPKDYINSELKPGGKFLNDNFTSATKERGLAVGCSEKRRGDPEDLRLNAGVFFEVESCHGRDVSAFSVFPNEREVLFLPRNPMVVVERTPPQTADGVYHVRLREALPCSNQSTVAETLSLPDCWLKDNPNGAKIYDSSESGTVIGSFQGGSLVSAFGKRNGRFAVSLVVKVAPGNLQCSGENCSRKRTIPGGPAAATLGGLTGVRFDKVSDSGEDGASGVLAPGIDLFVRKLKGPTDVENSYSLLYGYVDENDFKPSCRYIP